MAAGAVRAKKDDDRLARIETLLQRIAEALEDFAGPFRRKGNTILPDWVVSLGKKKAEETGNWIFGWLIPIWYLITKFVVRFPDEIAPKIFEPLTRGDLTRSWEAAFYYLRSGKRFSKRFVGTDIKDALSELCLRDIHYEDILQPGRPVYLMLQGLRGLMDNINRLPFRLIWSGLKVVANVFDKTTADGEFASERDQCRAYVAIMRSPVAQTYLLTSYMGMALSVIAAISAIFAVTQRFGGSMLAAIPVGVLVLAIFWFIQNFVIQGSTHKGRIALLASVLVIVLGTVGSGIVKQAAPLVVATLVFVVSGAIFSFLTPESKRFNFDFELEGERERLEAEEELEKLLGELEQASTEVEEAEHAQS